MDEKQLCLQLDTAELVKRAWWRVNDLFLHQLYAIRVAARKREREKITEIRVSLAVSLETIAGELATGYPKEGYKIRQLIDMAEETDLTIYENREAIWQRCRKLGPLDLRFTSPA